MNRRPPHRVPNKYWLLVNWNIIKEILSPLEQRHRVRNGTRYVLGMGRSIFFSFFIKFLMPELLRISVSVRFTRVKDSGCIKTFYLVRQPITTHQNTSSMGNKALTYIKYNKRSEQKQWTLLLTSHRAKRLQTYIFSCRRPYSCNLVVKMRYFKSEPTFGAF